MNDTQIIEWLEKNGEEIFWIEKNGVEYLVLRWIDDDGESRSIRGRDLRDTVRLASSEIAGY
jgi:hypothetical protein